MAPGEPMRRGNRERLRVAIRGRLAAQNVHLVDGRHRVIYVLAAFLPLLLIASLWDIPSNDPTHQPTTVPISGSASALPSGLLPPGDWTAGGVFDPLGAPFSLSVDPAPQAFEGEPLDGAADAAQLLTAAPGAPDGTTAVTPAASVATPAPAATPATAATRTATAAAAPPASAFVGESALREAIAATGWPPATWDRLVLIAFCESGVDTDRDGRYDSVNPSAVGGGGLYIGMLQISASANPAVAHYNLYDLYGNLQAGYNIWLSAGGSFAPWGCA